MTGTPSAADDRASGEPDIDPSVAHEARVYDFLLGGSTNFEVDREAAGRAGAAVGGIEVARAAVRGNRAFLVQVVRYLAGEMGIRQFLDIGTGIPNDDNVQRVVLEVAPDARVVSVDNDPIVLAHAHLLLEPMDGGATVFLLADLRDPDDVLRRAAETLDFSEPIAVLFNAVLHHIPDSDDPYGIVARFMDAVPSGSYLAVSHLTNEMRADEINALAESVPQQARYLFAARTKAEISRFFEGLELVPPGVVSIDQWRPDDPDAPVEGKHHYGAVARKP
ncbi:MAG TPA: SAM-dependent methyltransferase [Acidimicrobiales bacterium]|nr:SAM-dependent methyltransferase [Acidimicrobiales bacterium]